MAMNIYRLQVIIWPESLATIGAVIEAASPTADCQHICRTVAIRGARIQIFF